MNEEGQEERKKTLSSRPKTAGAGSKHPPPRKIVSAQGKKLREDARRIEMENKILQSRISSYGGPKTATYGAAVPKEQQGRPATATSTAPKQQEDSEEAKQYQKLLLTFNSLKQEIADSEEENKGLKAKLSNYDIQNKKFQQQIQLLKQQIEGTAQPNYNTPRYNRQSKGNGDDSKSVRSSSQSLSFRPTDEELMAAGKDDTTATFTKDAEYLKLKEEYDFLQAIRRGILERMEYSQTQCQNVDLQQDAAQRQFITIQQRLLAMHSNLSSNHTLIIAPSKLTPRNNNTSNVMAKSDDKAAAVDSKGPIITKEEDDLVLFNRYLTLQYELKELTETLEQNEFPGIMTYESNQGEYEQLLSLLRTKSITLAKEVNDLKKQGTPWSQQQQIQLENDNNNDNNNAEAKSDEKDLMEEIIDRRETLSLLKSIECKLGYEIRLNQARKQIQSNDLELSRLLIHRKEREGIQRGGEGGEEILKLVPQKSSKRIDK